MKKCCLLFLILLNLQTRALAYPIISCNKLQQGLGYSLLKGSNYFLNNVIKLNINNLKISDLNEKIYSTTINRHKGQVRSTKDLWIIGVLFFLILLFTLIKNIFSKQLKTTIDLFYNARSSEQGSRKNKLFNSLGFLFPHLLYALIFGIWLYLSFEQTKLSPYFTGFELFLIFSIIVIGLYFAKIMLLYLIAFIFDAFLFVKEHIISLYLFFSNIALVLLPVIIILILSSSSAIKYSYMTGFLFVAVYLFQFFRTILKVFFTPSFSIIYLFIYLCLIEVFPLIVFIKVLRF